MSLDPFAFVLVTLFAYRVTRFVVFDSLAGANLESRSKFSRRLDTWAFTQDGHDKSWVRGKIGGLLVCPFCIGFWISFASLGVYVWAAGFEVTSWVMFGVWVWAVAGAQSLVSIAERRLMRG